jgi:hypothetical protein
MHRMRTLRSVSPPRFAIALLTLMLLGVFLAPRPAHASVTYTFDVAGSSGISNPFSFSFTAPSFVTSGQSPAFTAFTVNTSPGALVTDSWTVTNDLVTATSGFGCFEFGAPPDTLSSCSASGIGGGLGLLLDVSGSLPTMNGTYTLSGGAGGDGEVFSLSGTLTVSSSAAAPEPSSLLLLGISLAGVFAAATFGPMIRRFAHS